ncbi:uncharacterized protein LOC111694243 [Trichogramma pretiosum]|uniref:uncharacterized protein LOC111694243 n=1 Tax=Trichogramma pretiosum TaxID=7493 RepID=UPI000C71A3B3|nr:uncharacterized protein LOC111694243 [Trichogramma pretiosum]
MLKKLFVFNDLPEIPGLEELDVNYYAGSKIFYVITLIWPGQNRLLQYFGRFVIALNFSFVMTLQLHTAYNALHPPINWEFAIQNLFEISFVSMMSSMYYIFCSMEQEVRAFTLMTVNFWNSITEPEQKDFMKSMSQFHCKITIVVRGLMMNF